MTGQLCRRFGEGKDHCNTYCKQQQGKKMKTDLRTFTFCGKRQGCKEFSTYKLFQAFIGPDQKRKDKFQNKNETKNERKKEKRKRKNFQEGRGQKPKMQACLNSQVIRKVKKVKQKKQKDDEKSYI